MKKFYKSVARAVITTLLFSLFSTFPAFADSVNKPIIILKLDDLCNDNVANFQKCFEILQSYEISNAGFGLIGEHLEDSRVTNELVSKITLWNNAGIEIWHHGYSHTEKEFNSDSDYNAQKESFRKTCDLLYQKTGITITSFGSPWNNANETTVSVIENEFPQIKCLMLVNASSSITNVRARANIETSVGVVSYESFVSNYNAKLGEDAVILQGHAGAWNDDSREQFKSILTFLKWKNATFMTPSQYADYVAEQAVEPIVEPKADVSEYFNAEKSAVGISWSKGTVTDNGNSSWTVSGTTASNAGWVDNRTEFGFDLNMGSGVAQTIAHAGWVMSNPNGFEINISYCVDTSKSKRVELAKWDMSAGTIKDSLDNSFVATVNPQSYQGDFFINLETKEYRLYFNNILFSEGSLQNKDYATKFKNLILNVPTKGISYSFTVSNVTRDVFDSGVTMNDVVAYILGNKDANNYYWSVSGYGNVSGTNGKRLVGSEDWVVNDKEPDYDGGNFIVRTHASNDDSGFSYRLRILNANGTYQAKGCLPQDSENNNIIHQSLDITPHLTGSNYGAIGFKGNNNPKRNKYKFGADNGFVSGNTYHFDILVNNKDKEYWILVDGEKRATGSGIGDSSLSGFIYTIGTAGADTLVLSNIVTKSYKNTVSMEDAVALVKNSSNYHWTFDGFDLYNNSIASGYNTRNNRVSYSGNNTAGYVVTANEDAAYWQFRLGNGNKVALPANTKEDNIIHQHLRFTPYFASGNKLTIGVRGNDAWQEEVLTVNADNGFVSGTEYDMHIIINNKNRAYMFIVDGEIKATGATWAARYPYWELVYYIDKSGDSMKLKNVTTKYYNSTVTMADVSDLCMTKVYAKIEGIAATGNTITANAKFMGPTTGANGTTKVIYALYDNEGRLAQSNIVDSAASLINGPVNVQSFTIPANIEIGDTLKVKTFMWNMDTLTPISGYSEATYTVE